MSVHSVDSSPPPAQTQDAARHDRKVTERREEAKKHDEAGHVERQERAEARGRKLDIKA